VTFAAASTVQAAGSLTASNAVVGNDATLRMTNAGTVNVAGDYQGIVKVDGMATLVSLADTSAATPFVINQLTVDSTADVTLTAAGAMTVDAAQLSPVRLLTINGGAGTAHFLNSSSLKNGQPGVLATEEIRVNLTAGDLNTQADPFWINTNTPKLTKSVPPGFTAWLAGNIFADEETRAQFVQALSGVSATHAEVARYVLAELKNNVGIGAVEAMVRSGLISMDELLAPLNYSSLEAKKADCQSEQQNGQACNN
jgi:hypothetical protein